MRRYTPHQYLRIHEGTFFFHCKFWNISTLEFAILGYFHELEIYGLCLPYLYQNVSINSPRIYCYIWASAFTIETDRKYLVQVRTGPPTPHNNLEAKILFLLNVIQERRNLQKTGLCLSIIYSFGGKSNNALSSPSHLKLCLLSMNL